MNRRKAYLLILALMAGALLVLSLSSGLPNQVRAQSGGGFDLTWWTVDGGGGQLSGGSFVLQGTAGQPDVGVLTGGGFRLSGGFWPGGLENHNIFLPVMVKP